MSSQELFCHLSTNWGQTFLNCYPAAKHYWPALIRLITTVSPALLHSFLRSGREDVWRRKPLSWWAIVAAVSLLMTGFLVRENIRDFNWCFEVLSTSHLFNPFPGFVPALLNHRIGCYDLLCFKKKNPLPMHSLMHQPWESHWFKSSLVYWGFRFLSYFPIWF